MTAKDYSTVVHERRSVRKYDSSYKLDRALLDEILEEATLAPSSRNLQPWRFIVIQDQELKKKIRSCAYNQEPLETASAVIAIIADCEMYHNALKIYRSKFDQGLMDEVTMQRQIDGIEQLVPHTSFATRLNIATFDCGLVSMQIMLGAKARGLDTVPIGGFDHEQVTEALDLDATRYEPILLLPIGKAEQPGFETTRLPLSDIVDYR
ncbi:nitroreductase family protein [Bacillus testis]|uniref:nitroreductase family protein n=1 Tax=Bacillus testis TaxID=1622072 RepID=UPI00067F558A|nr:nitroreductase family protein [Bacillus testis]